MAKIWLVIISVNVQAFVSSKLVLASKALSTRVTHIILQLLMHLVNVAFHLVAIGKELPAKL